MCRYSQFRETWGSVCPGGGDSRGRDPVGAVYEREMTILDPEEGLQSFDVLDVKGVQDYWAQFLIMGWISRKEIDQEVLES